MNKQSADVEIEEGEPEQPTIFGEPMKFRIRSDTSIQYSNEEKALKDIVQTMIDDGSMEILITIAPDDDIPMVVVADG